jgi:rhodanese-related sulfurtransferase
MDCSPPKRWKAANDTADISATFFDQTAPRAHLCAAANTATPPRPLRMDPSNDALLSRHRRLKDDMPTRRQDSGVCTALDEPRHDGGLSASSSTASLDNLPELDTPAHDGYHYITCSVLHSVRQFNAREVLLLDCRTALAFDRTRIAEAVSVQFSALMLRRLKKQANVRVRLDHLQLSDTAATASRKRDTTLVVVYDEDSVAVDPLSPAGVLLRILVDEGVRPVFLKGGMTEYRRLHPTDLGEPRPAMVPARKPLHPVLKAVARARPRADLPATEVLEHLVLGNRTQGSSVAFLKANGITHVINVTETAFAQPVINAVKCMQIPLIDSGKPRAWCCGGAVVVDGVWCFGGVGLWTLGILCHTLTYLVI